MKKITECLKRIGRLLGKPSKTFEEVYDENIRASILYFLVIILILTIIMLVLGAVFIKMFLSPFFEKVPWLKWISLPILLVFIPIFGFVATAIASFILHIFVLLFRGRGGFKQTFKTVIYASTPSVLSFWFPPLFVAGLVWSIVLTFKGLMKLQKLKTSYAVMAVLLPIIIVLAIGLLLRFV